MPFKAFAIAKNANLLKGGPDAKKFGFRDANAASFSYQGGYGRTYAYMKHYLELPHRELADVSPSALEPWAVDEKINRNQELEGFNVYSAKVEDDSVAGNFATRKRPKQPRRKKH